MATTPPRRMVLVPDLDGELEALLTPLEDMLRAIGTPLGDDEWSPPSELTVERSAEPVARIGSVVWRAGARSGRVLAPDGRYEHMALRVVEVSDADVAALGTTVGVLREARLPDGDRVVDGYLNDAEAQRRHGVTRRDDCVVGAWARLHGLLDLAPSEDTRVLIEQLGPGDRDVVLDPAGEAAFRRCVDRILVTWHDRDPLAPFLY